MRSRELSASSASNFPMGPASVSCRCFCADFFTRFFFRPASIADDYSPSFRSNLSPLTLAVNKPSLHVLELLPFKVMDVGEKKPKRKGPSCPVGIVKEKKCEGNGVDDKVDFPKMCFFSQAKKYINLKTLTTSPIVLGRPRYVCVSVTSVLLSFWAGAISRSPVL